MGMQVNTNISALNSYRNLSNTQNDLAKSLEKLSSGLRINHAADDAAGLAISQGLQSQVGGLTVASRNAQDGISVIQTAEGSLSEVQTILQRVRDLAVQSGNDSNNADSRTAIQTEVTALGSELTRISTSANFNGTQLLTGAATTAGLTFQIGAGSVAANDQINVKTTDVAAIATAVNAMAFTDSTAALASIASADTQITSVSTARASLGAQQNRFESVIRNLSVSTENLTAAKSRITDTDMASEMVKYTRSNILSQAGTAMLAQANQGNQGVLQLLR
ncbi:flagellin [Frigoribacterium sp. UYMn621]|jgi:flagellin|uniref:flagellin N-terminal helical domain-containing protein n=1 Tax=Frigoribacterium sp. UYMn621 TaxID=3156343 RepID=UPI003398E064